MNQESRANLLPEKDQNPEKDGRHETGVSKEMDVINLDSQPTLPRGLVEPPCLLRLASAPGQNVNWYFTPLV